MRSRAQGFIGVFENYHRYDPYGAFRAWEGNNWTEDEAGHVALSLEFATSKCKLPKDVGPVRVSLAGNRFDDEGRNVISQKLQVSRVFGGVIF